MTLDFSKLGGPNPADTVTQPRQLFSALPKKGRRFVYPRDVQAEVWAQWYERRDERDLVIKMNTGSGKTVVGLVILKNCLNEGKGPAVYVTPDNFLARQVIAEAEELGIATTSEPRDPHYQSGRAILVTNIFKVINGKSVFGTKDKGIQINIGSLVVDDVHACLNTAEAQFTITVPSDMGAYAQLLELFEDDLKGQSETGFLDVQAEDPTRRMVVPFWAWRRKQGKVAAILHAARDTDALRFSWPLLKDSLQFADAVFGRGAVEISLRCVPIDVIPAFAAARRRIFLTATLADDSVLLTAFDVGEGATRSPITPDNANDLGERLILTPHELSPDLTDEDLKELAKDLAKEVNVVVIVPSYERAEFWKDAAVDVLSAGNIEGGVAALKAGHRGLVVVVNRYDGIDLADDACRVLIIDRLPTVRRGIDQIDEAVLYGTDELLAQTVQRIEQGMGRGIRSAEDWCVVLLAGRSLTDHLYNLKAVSKLTPGTLSQLRLSGQVADQLRGKSVSAITTAIKQVLSRDQNWVQASKAALVGVRYDRAGRINPIAIAQRVAFNAAQAGNLPAAIRTIEDACNLLTDGRTKGWLKEQLAKLIDFLNEPQAQEVLLSASMDNRLVTKPLTGTGYRKLQAPARKQAENACEYIRRNNLDANGYLIRVDARLEDLVFQTDTAPAFERAVATVGELLGFGSQRPEREIGQGPDVLFALGGLVFLVIECKNGVISDTVSKSDANQLSGSLNWFKAQYDSTCSVTPILIHPSAVFERDATPPTGTRVMHRDALAQLRTSIRQLATGAVAKVWPPNPDDVARLLEHHGLTAGAFVGAFTAAPKSKK